MSPGWIQVLKDSLTSRVNSSLILQFIKKITDYLKELLILSHLPKKVFDLKKKS